MLFRKIFLSTAAVLFILSGTALGEEYTGYMKKKMSIGLKLGTNIFPDSDLTDFWNVEPDTPKFLPREISCEYKFLKNMGIEVAFGYSSMEDKSSSVFIGADDYAELDIANIYLSPTVKYYFPIKNSFHVFCGIGPDIIDTRGNLLYRRTDPEIYSTRVDVSRFGYGGHGLIGCEYYFFLRPAAHGQYDWPVSVEIQYKYTWVVIDNADRKLIDDLNSSLNTSYPHNDFNVGGHSVTLGLKWHLF